MRVQLVKRACYYNNPIYGLPIESLNEYHRTLDGWYIKVEAVFTRDNALLIRVTNYTLQAKSFLKVDFCGCAARLIFGGDSRCPDSKHDDMDTVITNCEEALSQTYCPKALVETIRGGERSEAFWSRCKVCLALLHGVVEAPNDDKMSWKLSFVRYYDLGPVSSFNDAPYSSLEAEEISNVSKLDYKRQNGGYIYKDCLPHELERFAKGNLKLMTPSRTDKLLGHLGHTARRCWRIGTVGQSVLESAPEKYRFIKTYACTEPCDCGDWTATWPIT